MSRQTANRTRKLTTIAMLAAISIVLVALIHFPIIPGATFLEYDPADVSILVGTFLFGPWAVLAGSIYQKWHTRKGALVGLLLGSLAMTAVMCLCNLIFTPLFMGGTAKDVAAMLIPIIIPFNLVKALGNSAITYLVYKPISKLVFGREQPVLTTSAK